MNSAAPDDDLRALLAAKARQGWMPGAVWRVEQAGGATCRGATGFAMIEPEREAMSEETPFDLASLTKPLCTALLLLLLEQEGRLALHAAAGDYLDELRDSAWASTSLQALATHTSGLPAWQPLYLSASNMEGYLGLIADLPPEAPAGEMLYSDLGYMLLGAILERLTGRPLDRLFEERIASPLGLRRIGFAARSDSFADAAATERGNRHERELAGRNSGYAWRSEVIRGRPHDCNAAALGGVAGHAGLFGTAAAVAGIARAMMSDGPLGLGPAAREKLLVAAPGGAARTVGFAGAPASSAARGVLPESVAGHTGFTGTSLWLDPAGGRLFILLTNRVHPVVQPRNFQLVRRAFHRLASRR